MGEKVSYRLAQEPGSYKILRHVRQVVKRRDTGKLVAPAVDAYFAWCAQQRRRRPDLLPTNPFAKALACACEREAGLRVFLDDPDALADTNHIERGIRSIPMGCRNWLFAWTELGAVRVGVIQPARHPPASAR